MTEEAPKTPELPEEITLTKMEALEAENLSLRQMMLARDAEEARIALMTHTEKMSKFMGELSGKYKADMRLYEMNGTTARLSRRGKIHALKQNRPDIPLTPDFKADGDTKEE